MKHRKLFLFAICLTICTMGWAAKKKDIRTETQVVSGVTIRLTYLSDDIIRVVKYPGTGVMPDKKSYSVLLPETNVDNPCVKASIDPQTGCVTFCDLEGSVLLRESGTPTLQQRLNAPDADKLRIGQRWTLTEDEDIYGLGQLRDEAMSWRGRDMELWNHNTYIAIPYVTSSRGYGLYWDNAGKSRFTDSAEGMQFTSEVAPCIDYYFIYRDGTQDGVMAAVRRLTGQATMFPLWTMGHWQCRERYKTSDELASVLDRYRQLQIPLDGIVLGLRQQLECHALPESILYQ